MKNQKTTKRKNSHSCNIQGELFRQSYEHPEVFLPDDIDKVIDKYLSHEPLARTKKKGSFYNVPCAFDIETSSFLHNGYKRACMYVWQLGINGAVIIGRTWDEFYEVIERISKVLGLSPKKKVLPIYVHNLAFEFQWIRHWFKWNSVFATDKRKPLRVLAENGVEFRCSYRLSGYSLNKTCENLLKYKVKKMVGDLDYSLIRNSKTPISEKEMGYCINDVIGVMCFIQEEIERNEGNITHIPMTSTGYARNICKDYCFGRDYMQKQQYEYFMSSMTMDQKELLECIEAYAGGFTHASARKVRRLLKNVASFDYTSDYPACMVAFNDYPVKKIGYVQVNSKEEFRQLCKKYTVFFKLAVKNIREKINIDHPLSYSKCKKVKNPVCDNGRVVSADYLETYINNIDLQYLEEYYDWDNWGAFDVLVYEKGYLPTPLIEAIAYLYKAKTELKGVEDKKEEYQHAKALLNALYGMCCTAILRAEILYDEDWHEEKRTPESDAEQLDDWNNNSMRFLHYSWGCVITSLARRNLLLSMKSVGEDYCYSDTDSVKIENYEKHLPFFENYNKWITKRIEKACKFHHLPLDTFRPKTIKGDEKPLGVWDFEGVYTYFKTLGAKRYAVLDGDVFNITVSGVNKAYAVPYMLDQFGIKYEEDKKDTTKYHITDGIEKIEMVFAFFDEGLVVPAEFSGKNCSTYIDYETKGYVTDYLGNKAEYHEYSSIHMGPSEYALSISDDFKNYIEYVVKLYAQLRNEEA